MAARMLQLLCPSRLTTGVLIALPQPEKFRWCLVVCCPASDCHTFEEAICDFALGVVVLAPFHEASAQLVTSVAACLPFLTFVASACMVYWPGSKCGTRVAREERELLEGNRKRNDAGHNDTGRDDAGPLLSAE